jgi:hypothetical protein
MAERLTAEYSDPYLAEAGRSTRAYYSWQYSASRNRDPASAGKAELPD